MKLPKSARLRKSCSSFAALGERAPNRRRRPKPPLSPTRFDNDPMGPAPGSGGQGDRAFEARPVESSEETAPGPGAPALRPAESRSNCRLDERAGMRVPQLATQTKPRPENKCPSGHRLFPRYRGYGWQKHPSAPGTYSPRCRKNTSARPPDAIRIECHIEINEHRSAISAQEDVGRLEVSVQNAFSIGVG